MGISMDESAVGMHMMHWLFSVNEIIGNKDN